jgi:HPt (histidine-containing phosphotransfer) domain-containing protein
MNLNDILEGNSFELLDNAVIDGLRELGGDDDPGLVLELVEIFVDDAPKRIEEMLQGLESGDFTLMQRSAHTLKSSAANMGAMVLSQVCRRMEAAARSEDKPAYEGMVEACREVYARSESALRSIS